MLKCSVTVWGGKQAWQQAPQPSICSPFVAIKLGEEVEAPTLLAEALRHAVFQNGIRLTHPGKGIDQCHRESSQTRRGCLKSTVHCTRGSYQAINNVSCPWFRAASPWILEGPIVKQQQQVTSADRSSPLPTTQVMCDIGHHPSLAHSITTRATAARTLRWLSQILKRWW